MRAQKLTLTISSKPCSIESNVTLDYFVEECADNMLVCCSIDVYRLREDTMVQERDDGVTTYNVKTGLLQRYNFKLTEHKETK